MLLRSGRVVDPAQDIDALRDIRVRDGLVVAIGENLVAQTDESVIDLSGCIVAPGFIDMHVHLREPGFPEKETLETGTRAAVHGGFTTIACMPNTEPALDSVDALQSLASSLEQHAHCTVLPIAAITAGRKGEQLLDYAALRAAGAVGYSDDGNTVMDARVLRDAALAARDVPGPFISHAEDEHIKGDAVMHEGETSRRLGVRGSSGLAEDVIVARDLLIAGDTGKAWHIAHTSTRIALDLVRFARARAIAVSCEITPHHLVFTDEAVEEKGAQAKVNPPLRSGDDLRACRDAVRDGTVDVFATDHAPHTAAEKSGSLATAAVGFTGLEIAVGAYAYAVPNLPMRRFVELCSTNPARILGLASGSLHLGARADITVFADRSWVVDPAEFASKGRATPFVGMTLPRRVVLTLVGGVIAYNGLT